MRIVTWNAERNGYAAFNALVQQVVPDVAIVNEFGKSLPSAPPAVTSWHRFGTGPYRSQVAAFGPWHADALTLPAVDAVDVAAFRVTGPVSFDLVAVWAGYPKGATAHAVVAAARAWDAHLGQQRVVAGDFNSSSRMPMTGDLAHSAVVACLAEWGLVSAYHRSAGVAHGDEKEWTWRRPHDGLSHHIDYIFVPTDWTTTCEIMAVDEGDSDHRAVVVDVSIHE